MTESDWLQGTDPEPMIRFLREEQTHFRTRWVGWVARPRFRVSERKWRLFYCACMRLIAHVLPAEACRQLIDVVERQADGLAGSEEVEAAIAASMEACLQLAEDDAFDWPQQEAVNAVSRFHREEQGNHGTLFHVARAWASAACSERFLTGSMPAGSTGLEDPKWTRQTAVAMARQAALLREVMGNSFHARIVDAVWLAWQDSTIPRMARTIYDERRFDDLPILADALEDAGCCDEAMLSHCRAETDHVRGCWLVDLILSFS